MFTVQGPTTHSRSAAEDDNYTDTIITASVTRHRLPDSRVRSFQVSPSVLGVVCRVVGYSLGMNTSYSTCISVVNRCCFSISVFHNYCVACVSDYSKDIIRYFTIVSPVSAVCDHFECDILHKHLQLCLSVVEKVRR